MVSRRTLEKDIHDMRSDTQLGYFAPIKFDHFYGAYYYDDPGYSIDKLPLNHDDLEALSFASAVLEQYGTVGIFSTFSGAVQKIMNTMMIKRQLDKYPSVRCVGIENFPVIKGQELLPVILDAILERKVITLDHQRFDTDEVHHHIVHPYYLKEYHNRWYLVGYQPENKRIQSYGLERIRMLKTHAFEKFTDISFAPDEYFRNAVGIMVTDEPPVDIILKFSAKQGMYILTQPIHESQAVVKQTKKFIAISLHLVPEYEFISMVLAGELM